MVSRIVSEKHTGPLSDVIIWSVRENFCKVPRKREEDLGKAVK